MPNPTPAQTIPNWDKVKGQLGPMLVQFALNSGFSEDEIKDRIGDGRFALLMYKAMLFDAGRSKTAK